jgi:hypothetical protein
MKGHGKGATLLYLISVGLVATAIIGLLFSTSFLLPAHPDLPLTAEQKAELIGQFEMDVRPRSRRP